MNWLLKSIVYWILLIGSLVGGAALIGYSMINWSLQDAPVFGELNRNNRELLYSGVALLVYFRVYSKDRKSYPLKKHSEHNKTAAEISKTFHPKIIELNTNIHGLPVLHSCGAPSPIRFKAVQLSPDSDRRAEDYERIFYNSANGEIVEYDKTKPDHRELNEHFLWMINSSRIPNLPNSYLKQYNIIKTKTDGEKRTETLH